MHPWTTIERARWFGIFICFDVSTVLMFGVSYYKQVTRHFRDFVSSTDACHYTLLEKATHWTKSSSICLPRHDWGDQLSQSSHILQMVLGIIWTKQLFQGRLKILFLSMLILPNSWLIHNNSHIVYASNMGYFFLHIFPWWK